MNDGYTADAERLATEAGQFDGLAGRVGAIHRTLTETLAENGRCWGADAVGQSFGSAHAGPADATVTQLGSLPEQLGGVGARFAGTAAQYTSDDQGGVDRLRAAGPDIAEA
ncbi:hypothetical protein [Actinophytocola sp.]|uniref:hypothetical protein n=1 Tax=Actinophytocola sp. TaxID=1872138 RepID=UPI002ED9ACFF